MDKTKIKVLILLLLVALGIYGCCREKTKQNASDQKSENNASDQPSIQVPPVVAPQQNNAKANTRSVKKSPSHQLSRMYSRENPFLPIETDNIETNNEASAQQSNETIEAKKEHLKAQKEKSVREVTIRLIGIIGEDTAFFDEEGSTKIVSIGDVIAEMKVLEIRGNKVTLGKDNVKHELKPGEQFKAKTVVEN